MSDARTFVLNANVATGSSVDPKYCIVTVTPEFLEQLQQMRALCEANDLTEVRRAYHPDRWGGAGWEEASPTKGANLVVSNTGVCWFADEVEGIRLNRIESESFTRDQLLAMMEETLFNPVFSNDEIRDLYEEDQLRLSYPEDSPSPSF